MKILPVEKIREADEYTIRHEPISHVDLMERAATACYYWFLKNISPERHVQIFCGTGNNGGDGLAIARLLACRGYKTHVFIFGEEESLSPSSRINYNRLESISSVKIRFLKETSRLPVLNPGNDVIIDSLFGSGLSRPIEGFVAKVIDLINHSGTPVVSIDVPSGMFCDKPISQVNHPAVVKAWDTLTFSPPKLALFFPENAPYFGDWHLLDIGISKEYLDQTETENFYITEEDISSIIRPRKKFAHKGNFGHALLFCGSKGKMGAAILSARGCLRAGAGLVSLHIPSCGNDILQSSVPEAMLDLDRDESFFTELPDLTPFKAIGVGPGIGKEDQTQRSLKLLIQNAFQPVVFDADAINILGENKTWIPFIRNNSIFTPHPREFERLVGKSENDFDRNRMQREFSKKYGMFLVLKGAHTAITTPQGHCWFNSTGNPGMATGGSGDVLTGILTGLLSQGYSPLESCLMGVFLHGLAGDIAAENTGEEALIANDLVTNLGQAFLKIYGKL
ncbi:MAG: NAD(P)H-hydrate dehydratase [Bacteroidota bacterium]|nr:NAD(P)H-hydrate dehydratase [Bacteroidota bacterium]